MQYLYRYQTGTLCETGRQVELLLFLGYLPPQQHAVRIDIRQRHCVRLGDTQTGRTVVVSWLLTAPATSDRDSVWDWETLRQVELLLFLGCLPPQQHAVCIDIRQGHCVRLGDTQVELLFLGCLPPQQHAISSISDRDTVWDWETCKTVASWLLVVPATCNVYLRDRSVETILCAAMLRLE